MNLLIPFLVEYDKSQAEWVVVAYEADDPKMIEAIESGQDIHAWTAHLIYNVPIEEILLEEQIFKAHDLGSETSERVISVAREKWVYPNCPHLQRAPSIPRNMLCRQGGKKSNHALNYDEGALTFARTSGITVADARRNRDLYRRVYSGIPRWHARIVFTLKTLVDGPTKVYRRTLTNCFNREMYFMGPLGGKNGEQTFRQAYSAIPQSTVADIASNAMVAVVANMAGRVQLKSNNHDSLLIQHYLNHDAFHQVNSRAAEVSKILLEMGEIFGYLDPELESTYTHKKYRIRTDAKMGLSWGKLEKVKPARIDVERMLERIDKEALNFMERR